MNRRQRRSAAMQNDPNSLAAVAWSLEQDGKIPAAIETYRRALAAKPALHEAHSNLGNLLRNLGDIDQAALHFRTAINLQPENAIYLNNLGNVLLEYGQLGDAAALFRKAIALQPNYFEPHNGLGIALVELGQIEEAVDCYSRSIDLNPRNIRARINLGIALASLGRNVEALEHAEFAARSSGEPAFPHHLLGLLLARCGAKDAAKRCFTAHLQRDPGDREGVRLMLAALGGAPIPERASRHQLDQLYARRAAHWDERAGGVLGYRGADLISAMLDRFAAEQDQLDIVDAGCGTGLVGSRVASKARRLLGVDTSQPMIEKARAKGLYHRLHQGDLVAFLNDHPESFDVVTCAATLIHFGDLKPAFEAAAHCLRDRGLFIFTLFPNEGDPDAIAIGSFDGFAEGGCYCHGYNYVVQLAAKTGFTVEALDRDVHEHFQRKPKIGLIGALRRNRERRVETAAA